MADVRAFGPEKEAWKSAPENRFTEAELEKMAEGLKTLRISRPSKRIYVVR